MLAVRCGPPTLYGASALAASRQTRSPMCKARSPGRGARKKAPPPIAEKRVAPRDSWTATASGGNDARGASSSQLAVARSCSC